MDQVISGLSKLFHHSVSWVEENADSSSIVFSYLSAATMLPLVAESSFEVTCLLLNSESIKKEKYGECVDLLLSYPTSAASLTGNSSARLVSGALVSSDTK